MLKDFDSWNLIKKNLNSKNNYLPFYRERQIRWCSLGVNLGYEQDGTGKDFARPVLILKGFNRYVCLVIPLTTSKNKNSYLIPIGLIDNKKAKVIISQIRLIDTKRLDKHITTINKSIFTKIKKAIKDLL